MNIYTVRDNLKNTIAGKETHLAKMSECIAGLEALGDRGASWSRANVVVEFLKINIDELNKILADVEKCCEQSTLDSWTTNPDRMGGQFTEEEIRRAGEWR